MYRLSLRTDRTIRKKVRVRKFAILQDAAIGVFNDGVIITSSQTNRSQVNILAALTIALFLSYCIVAPLRRYILYIRLSNIDLTLIFSSYGFGVLLALFLSRRLTITDKNARLLWLLR